MVILRSYDGDNGIKINETMVNNKMAISSGLHSLPDTDDRTSSQESLNSLPSASTSAYNQTLKPLFPIRVSAFIILKDLVERSELSRADKRSSLIKVTVSCIVNPSEFYVQIDRPEVIAYFETQEKEIHKEYSSSKHQFLGDMNFVDSDFCAFKVGNDWRRGEVMCRLNNLDPNKAPEEPIFKVKDIDYGNEFDLKVSQMRRLSDEFKKDGPFALKCKLFLLRPTAGDQWTHTARDEFKDFVNNYKKDLFILVKNNVEKEPISVKLYAKELRIPDAFAKEIVVYKSINTFFIVQGLATYERKDSSINGVIESETTDDDKEINEDIVSEKRNEMPFNLLYSSNESVLESLQNRFTNNSNIHSIGKPLKYMNEENPKRQSFYGTGTDHEVCKDYYISFREYHENFPTQPLQVIEQSIIDAMREKGELDPYVGDFTKGNACTAYFEFDKTWNRAEIVGVTKANEEMHSKLMVRFVDYGNHESILVDKLSSQVFKMNIPKLAIRCRIINIKPRNEAADKDIRNIIYTRVVDKKCKFFWEVSLFLYYRTRSHFTFYLNFY